MAAAIGAIAALGSLSIPLYIQHRLSDAIFRTLESMDSYIESRLPNIEEVAKDPSPLNDMIELRENLAKSLRLPGNVVAVLSVQLLAALAMIVGIINGLLKWGG